MRSRNASLCGQSREVHFRLVQIGGIPDGPRFFVRFQNDRIIRHIQRRLSVGSLEHDFFGTDDFSAPDVLKLMRNGYGIQLIGFRRGKEYAVGKLLPVGHDHGGVARYEIGNVAQNGPVGQIDADRHIILAQRRRKANRVDRMVLEIIILIIAP